VICILTAFVLDQAQKPLRSLVLASFIISTGSLLITVSLIFPVQEEIRARYPKSINGERAFLMGLFYFARGFFLLVGTLILIGTLNRKDVLINELVEVSGNVVSVEVYGDENPDLKIVLENNSNEYETPTFKVPDNKLEEIENKLQPGEFVFVLIDRNDENAMNDLYVQIYGIRTEAHEYLSLAEYNEANAANSSIGSFLGLCFAGPGLIYLLIGRIQAKPDKVMRTGRNVSKA
jgi:hypothetical protein